jgi:hypothetical protein
VDWLRLWAIINRRLPRAQVEDANQFYIRTHPEQPSFSGIDRRKDALSGLERVEETLAVLCRLMEKQCEKSFDELRMTNWLVEE